MNKGNYVYRMMFLKKCAKGAFFYKVKIRKLKFEIMPKSQSDFVFTFVAAKLRRHISTFLF
jgi:hypothetical protein